MDSRFEYSDNPCGFFMSVKRPATFCLQAEVKERRYYEDAFTKPEKTLMPGSTGTAVMCRPLSFCITGDAAAR